MDEHELLSEMRAQLRAMEERINTCERMIATERKDHLYFCGERDGLRVASKCLNGPIAQIEKEGLVTRGFIA